MQNQHKKLAILLDIMMPKMNGKETLKELKKNKNYRSMHKASDGNFLESTFNFYDANSGLYHIKDDL